MNYKSTYNKMNKLIVISMMFHFSNVELLPFKNNKVLLRRSSSHAAGGNQNMQSVTADSYRKLSGTADYKNRLSNKKSEDLYKELEMLGKSLKREMMMKMLAKFLQNRRINNGNHDETADDKEVQRETSDNKSGLSDQESENFYKELEKLGKTNEAIDTLFGRVLLNKRLNAGHHNATTAGDNEGNEDTAKYNRLQVEGNMTGIEVQENNDKATDIIADENGFHTNPHYVPYSNGEEFAYEVEHQGYPIAIPESGEGKRNFLKHYKFQGRYWENGIVPYKFDSNFPFEMVELVELAIDMLKHSTCIQLVPKVDADSYENYIIFKSGQGCWSLVGKMPFKGPQYISLQTDGCKSLSTVFHEILHALGSAHEQTRMDRYKTLSIEWSKTGNYRTQYYMESDVETDSYDLSSVMQYKIPEAFNLKDPDLSYLLRTDHELSFYDIKTITENYECTANCYAVTCLNAGFQSSDCGCKCPDGLTGSDCSEVVTDIGCGGVIELASGQTKTIQSPNYPTYYDLNKMCTWLVKAPIENRIKLTLKDFHTHVEQDNCVHYLLINYNLIGQPGFRLCGNLKGERQWITNVNAEYNLLLLKFVTTHYGEAHKGFSATVNAFISGCYSDPCKHGATCTDTDLSPHYKCACAKGYSGSHCNKVTAYDTVTCGFETDYMGPCVLESVRENWIEWQVVSKWKVHGIDFTYDAKEGQAFARVNPYSLYIKIKAELETSADFVEAERTLTFWYVSYNAESTGQGFQVSYEGTNQARESLFEPPANDREWHHATVQIPAVEGLKIVFSAYHHYGNDIYLLDDVSIQPKETETKVHCKSVVCESWSDYERYERCNVPGAMNITSIMVEEERSVSSCMFEKTFGTLAGDIWVNNGCQATFEVCFTPGSSFNVYCKSENFQRTTCYVGNDITIIEIFWHLSYYPCIRGYSYGKDGDHIYVDHGCNAEFRVYKSA